MVTLPKADGIAKIATSARIAIIAKARATANPFAADFADER